MEISITYFKQPQQYLRPYACYLPHLPLPVASSGSICLNGRWMELCLQHKCLQQSILDCLWGNLENEMFASWSLPARERLIQH